MMTHEKRQKICKMIGEVYESAQAISKIAMAVVKDSHRIDAGRLAKSHKAIMELARIMDEEIAGIKTEMGTR